jgi:hypothetical protein
VPIEVHVDELYSPEELSYLGKSMKDTEPVLCDFCDPNAVMYADYKCHGCGALMCKRCTEEQGIKLSTKTEMFNRFGISYKMLKDFYFCHEDDCPADAVRMAEEYGVDADAGHALELADLRERGLKLVVKKAA